MTIKRFRPDLIILLVLALGTRLWDVFQPANVVFDEVYFKIYTGDYFTGNYYFDIHPPLGKLLLAGWAWLLHLNPTNLIATDQPSVALRTLPALAGALIIPLFYIFLRQLKATRVTALLGAFLLLVENALIVESRFILTDSLLILFGLGAVCTYLASRHQHSQRRRYSLILLAALLSGLALSIKWTGLAALGLIGIIWISDQIRRLHSHRVRWNDAIIQTEGLSLIVAPLLVYMAVFYIHFQLLPNSGAGDAFMTPQFQSTLNHSTNYQPNAKMSFFAKFEELNQEMIHSEDSLKNATHPYGSKWYSWPMMIRGVYYWQGATDSHGDQGNIYLLGNPVIWWGILFCIPLCLLVLVGNFRKAIKPYQLPLAILVLGYILNFLPFSNISRVMFLYHYFFALLYSLALAVLLGQIALQQISQKYSTQAKRQLFARVYTVVGIAAFAGFLFMAPLTYGLPLSPSQIQSHMLLKTWR